MGYAASVSTDDIAELRRMADAMDRIDPRFSRLHLAGAGMWFGLEGARSPERVAEAFHQLGPFGEAYAYEGYGFAKTLFYVKSNPEVLRFGTQLRPQAAANFYHGVGRALWILIGSDAQRRTQMLEKVPDQYRSDAYSGYGMGVAFTKVDDPGFVLSFAEQSSSGGVDLDDYLTGVTMGYSIRQQGDPAYVSAILGRASARDRCRVTRLIDLGKAALDDAQHKGGDLHENWRSEIRKRLTEHGRATSAVSGCA